MHINAATITKLNQRVTEVRESKNDSSKIILNNIYKTEIKIIKKVGTYIVVGKSISKSGGYEIWHTESKRTVQAGIPPFRSVDKAVSYADELLKHIPYIDTKNPFKGKDSVKEYEKFNNIFKDYKG